MNASLIKTPELEQEEVYLRVHECVQELLQDRFPERYSLDEFATLTAFHAERCREFARKGNKKQALEALRLVLMYGATAAYYFGIPSIKERPL